MHLGTTLFLFVFGSCPLAPLKCFLVDQVGVIKQSGDSWNNGLITLSKLLFTHPGTLVNQKEADVDEGTHDMPTTQHHDSATIILVLGP